MIKVCCLGVAMDPTRENKDVPTEGVSEEAQVVVPKLLISILRFYFDAYFKCFQF